MLESDQDPLTTFKNYYEFHRLGSGRETGCSTRSCGETSHTAAGEFPEEWLTRVANNVVMLVEIR